MTELLKFSNKDIIKKGSRVYQGNCIDILSELPEKKINLVFADPPYNLQLQQELYRPNQTKVDGVNDSWDQFTSFSDYDNFTIKWLTACRRVMKDDATIWVIGSYHNIFRVGKIMMDLGFWILNDIQWAKTNPMPNFRGVRFTNATETLIWAKKSKEQKKYVFNYQVMKQLNGGKQMTSVWSIPLCTGNERIKNKYGKKAHSTQKPEELLKRIILASSNEKDLILDPFVGSGTTCAVAKKLNRQSIGIEKEVKYLKIIEKRLLAIDPNDYVNLRITEPNKKLLSRVSMQELVQKKYLHENQILYTKNKKYSAMVLDNGNIKNELGIGSIHQIGAKIRNMDSCNGWHYWYYDNDGELLIINNLRDKYRVNYGLQAI